MNYYYKKMYNKNYIVLDNFDIPALNNDYKLEMLKRNHIQGLLDLQLTIDNNNPIYHYNISSKQSFNSYFYDTKIQKEFIFTFFTSLNNLLINLNKYLLDYDHVVLIPQCIFCDKEVSSFYFLYCPNYKQDFFSSLKEFISYLLTITDHDDEATVLISYSLWQETQNDNFNLKSLMDVFEKKSYTSEQVNIDQPIIENEVLENKENSILKEPDILLKENYSYETDFMIKNVIIYILSILSLIGNTIFNILDYYSTETFFVLTLIIIVFVIFYSSKLIRTAPLHRIYTKQEDFISTNTIHINPTITPIQTTSIEEVKIVNSDDINETVLLCVNSKLTNKFLIYTGIDFSQEVEITSYPFTIGKHSDNQLIINNPAISRHHARIIFENDSYFIEDLNSSNGIKVNDEVIPSYTLTEITSGDNITFAHLTYIFQ